MSMGCVNSARQTALRGAMSSRGTCAPSGKDPYAEMLQLSDRIAIIAML